MLSSFRIKLNYKLKHIIHLITQLNLFILLIKSNSSIPKLNKNFIYIYILKHFLYIFNSNLYIYLILAPKLNKSFITL